MPPVSPCQIINKPEGRPHFDVCTRIVQRDEIVAGDIERQYAPSRVVERRTVDVELHFVEYGGAERVLQRDHVICRMIDDCLIVPRDAPRETSRRVPQTDITLRPTVKKSFVTDLVVNPYQPGIFVYRRLPSDREQVLIVEIAWIGGASLPLKGGVGEHEPRLYNR